MEYHAIEQAESFERILNVLKDRAAHGVEVRIFYDDVGSIGFINHDSVNAWKKMTLHAVYSIRLFRYCPYL